MRQYFKLLCVLIGLGLLSAILAWTAPRTLAGGPWYVSTAGNDASSLYQPGFPLRHHWRGAGKTGLCGRRYDPRGDGHLHQHRQ